MATKSDRALCGVTGQPHPATRILGREMDSSKFAGKEAHCLLVIDEKAGTVTGMNVYGGGTGAGYDPTKYRQPLPAAGSDKWKEWTKKGYGTARESNGQPYLVSDFACLVSNADAPKAPVTEEVDAEHQEA